MGLRALLIKPRKVGARQKFVEASFEPLGILSVAGFVRKYSPHSVSVIDAQSEDATIHRIEGGLYRRGMSDANLRERIRVAKPDVVGISSLFEVNEAEAIAIARLVKSISSDTLVVIGGLDAGVRYREYLRSGVVDLIVRGYGEETFVDILNRRAHGEPLTGIEGTCEPIGRGDARMNPPRVPRVALDDYPYPARDLVPRELYQERRRQRVSWPFASTYPMLLMQASRGCKLKCAFCDIVAVHDRWTHHSPEYVIGEIEHCMRTYGMREVSFVDDNFMMEKSWSMRIFDLIIERRLDLAVDIMSGVSVWTLSEPMIDKMIQAGVARVQLPIESGNPDTIRYIKKPINLDKVVQMVDYCNRKGLYTHANLIIGFPFETAEDIQRTFDFAERSGIDQINFYVAEPFEEARMFATYRENGWVSGTGLKKSWRTQHFTRRELEAMAGKMASKYLRKRAWFYLDIGNAVRYLWPKLCSIRKLRYAVRIGFYALFDGQGVLDSEPTPLLARQAPARPVLARN